MYEIVICGSFGSANILGRRHDIDVVGSLDCSDSTEFDVLIRIVLFLIALASAWYGLMWTLVPMCR